MADTNRDESPCNKPMENGRNETSSAEGVYSHRTDSRPGHCRASGARGLFAYQDQLRTARRSQAQADLMELAAFRERLFTENSRYSDAGGNLPTRPFTRSPRNSSKPAYNLSLSDVTSDGFTLRHNRSIPKRVTGTWSFWKQEDNTGKPITTT
jgi:Tfp pilus assembly protein PilE